MCQVVQFESSLFEQLLQKYNVFHSFTALQSPQADASERVNRSVLAAIRPHVSSDQNNSVELLSSISCDLKFIQPLDLQHTIYYLDNK